MKRVYITLLTFLVVALTTPSAHALLSVEGRYWLSTLDSKIKSTESGLTGTELDLVDDLGVDKSNGFGGGRVTLELGKHKLRYGYVPLSWEGQKTLSQSIDFAGKTYTATARVDSSLDMKYHRLGYEYDLLDTLGNKVGIIVEAKYFNIDARLKADTLGYDERTSTAAPVPTIGATVQVGLPLLFSVGGELTGMTLGSRGYLLDGEVAVNVKPFPFVSFSGGYRILKMKFEDGDDKGVFDLSGPFLVVRGSF